MKHTINCTGLNPHPRPATRNRHVFLPGIADFRPPEACPLSPHCLHPSPHSSNLFREAGSLRLQQPSLWLAAILALLLSAVSAGARPLVKPVARPHRPAASGARSSRASARVAQGPASSSRRVSSTRRAASPPRRTGPGPRALRTTRSARRLGPASGSPGSGRSHTTASADTYAPPLLPHTPLPSARVPLAAGTSAAQQDPAASTSTPPDQPQSPSAATSLPLDPAAEPIPIDENAVHTVGQQLAQGGTALQFPSALRHFFHTLRQRELTPANGTVRVLQFGDSHTAADMFTGEARARMQNRFGDGGVGFSYAGHPFAGYRILGSGRGQSGSWQTLGTHFTQLGDAELGLGGVAVQTSRSGDTVTLDAPCLTLQVQYLRQPGGGSFQLNDNGAPVQSVSTASAATDPAVTGTGDSTDAYPSPSAGASLPPSAPTNTSPYAADGTLYGTRPAPAGNPYTDSARPNAEFPSTNPATDPAAPAAGTLRHDCSAGSHHFTLTSAGDGPVRLLGTVALQPGITWESIGINGAEAPLLLRWNQAVFHSYLAAATPDLIVLAYGTNEAAARWSGEEYRATFARLIDTLHRTAPAASILVVGPADRSLGSTTYTVIGRGRRARRIAHRYYLPFRGTARIINAQREVCSTHDCAFWDWQARQGGLGAMNRWVAAGYAQPDHTHFTGTGYHALADALIADLLSAYSGSGT